WNGDGAWYPAGGCCAYRTSCYDASMTDPKTPEKHAGGRPLKFDNVAELEKRIEAYFKECDREEDSRIFKHGKEVLEKIPTIEKGKRVLKKRIVCSVCRQELWSRGCMLVSGALKLKKPYTVTGLAVWLDTS